MANQIKAKKIVIALAGTPTQVDALTQTRELRIKNPYANTGVVYFGGSDLAATKQVSLQSGEWSPPLLNVDLSQTYVDVAVNGEAVEVFFYV